MVKRLNMKIIRQILRRRLRHTPLLRILAWSKSAELVLQENITPAQIILHSGIAPVRSHLMTHRLGQRLHGSDSFLRHFLLFFHFLGQILEARQII